MPDANRFKERMMTLDPKYGSQKHQQGFLRRYERRQEIAPCPKDHEHTDACYATEGGRDGSFSSFGEIK